MPWGQNKVAVLEKFKQESMYPDCPPKKLTIVGRWPLWRGDR